jgi:phenol 2-monooxygenase
VIDVLAIFQQSHRELSPSDLPAVLLPRKGRFGLIDYEKAFCPDPSPTDIFDLRGINRDDGCVVIVRPDQYVSDILPLDATDALSAFLDGILAPAGE